MLFLLDQVMRPHASALNAVDRDVLILINEFVEFREGANCVGFTNVNNPTDKDSCGNVADAFKTIVETGIASIG